MGQTSIPKIQRSVWIDSPGPHADVQIRDDIPVPALGDGQVLVKMLCSGICHSDVYNIRGVHPMTTNTPGHEGVGTVVDIGKGVDRTLLNQRVVETIQNLTNGYGAHAVICTAGSPSAYDQALKMLRRKGTLVCVGLPRLDYHLQISPMEMVVRSLTVVGSSVGTAKELQELLQMASEGTVVPHFIVFGLEEVGDVIVKLERSGVAGRVVLRISSE
ncbi:putative alcohol dehydrogenase [Phaeomoniella chlamydospora]|uniref:Putative alcohol dehydrogenase n=1 Tax=Phaeomoniella chlamydospora TaxID=158046 RepID=A0A0G2H1J0_PHACM|nr:putative alcohol dehydrogenase [Phaeomoniella chlamydospora]